MKVRSVSVRGKASELSTSLLKRRDGTLGRDLTFKANNEHVNLSVESPG